MVWFFLLFLISGFCSILYEIVWLRLAMAQFGVTSALTSIVLSMFMAGLGLGSWGSGPPHPRLRENRSQDSCPAPLRAGGITHRHIGLAGSIPVLFGTKAAGVDWPYLLPGPTILALVSASLSPWFRGAPAWERRYRWPCWRSGSGDPRRSERSFSYLYLANVLGAVVGATVPLLLIELYGFRGTLKIGAACNAALALSAMMLSLGADRAVAANGDAPKAAAMTSAACAGHFSSGPPTGRWSCSFSPA